MRKALQACFLGCYRAALASGALETPWGRSLFEAAYDLYKRRFEAGPVGALRPLVTPGSTVLDVGANVGFFSERFGRWVGENGRVVAVEPEPRNAARLRRRLAARGLAETVDVIEAAAAERSGEGRLEINPRHPGDHRIGERGRPVSLVTVDDLMAARGWPPVSLIKIDVQGAEARVLEGARQTIARWHPALFVEIDDEALIRMGASARALCETLIASRYAVHRLAAGGPSAPLASPALDRLLARRAYVDLLFISAGRRARGGA